MNNTMILRPLLLIDIMYNCIIRRVFLLLFSKWKKDIEEYLYMSFFPGGILPSLLPHLYAPDHKAREVCAAFIKLRSQVVFSLKRMDSFSKHLKQQLQWTRTVCCGIQLCLTLIALGGGAKNSMRVKLSEKSPCLHNNTTTWIEQISLFNCLILP